MRFIESLCPPAFLYLAFLTINVALDVSYFNVLTAASKVLFGGLTVWFLQLLCRLDLGVVSWFIVALPFVVTALATAVAMGNEVDSRILGGQLTIKDTMISIVQPARENAI
jgi:hypothetical protein